MEIIIMETTNVKATEVSNKANGKHEPTVAELMVRIAQLEQAANAKKHVAFSIAEASGGVMATGLRRFPTTLYYDEWILLLDAIKAQDLRGKLEAWKKAGLLKTKGNKAE